MKRRSQTRSGVAALELALSFGLLWLLLGGTFRFGYAMYTYHELVSAAAGAARYAARVDFDEPNHAFVAAVKNMAVYGSPTGGTAAFAPGLLPGHILVTWTRDSKDVPLTITVAVSGYSVDTLFQTFTWTGRPSVTVRYSGIYKS